MLTQHTFKKITWVDAETPTNSEAKELMQAHDIHPAVAEELLSPTLKPKVDVYKNYIYLILHFPAIKHTHSNEKNQEVDFIIGKHFLITTHYDTIDAMHKFSQEFEVSTILDGNKTTKHAGIIFYYLIRKLYGSITHELEYIGSSLDSIEDNIFLGREKEMVLALSRVSRNLIDISQTIEDHGEILKLLAESGQRILGKPSIEHFNNILHEYKVLEKSIAQQREFLDELRETNDSLLSTKQNEVMKVLTIMAFVTFPLSLIASIFGMNTRTLPLVGFRGDFWIVIAIMSAMTICMFIFFKYKKWL